ncbi:TPA: oligosaccharide flippase family protein, partial [Streptococcus pneumoniae]
MTKKSITRNFIFNTILTMSSFIFPLISFPYVSRVLMADGLGRVTFASSIIDYALTFAMLGMPLYGVKVCAGYIKNKEKLSQTVRELLVINLLVGFLVMLLLATMVIIIPRFRQEWQLIIITSSTIPLNIIGIEWLYKALEDYSYISIRTLTFKILGFLLMFLVVRTKDDYMVYAAITVLASHGSFILNFFRSRTFLLENISQRLNLKQHIKPLLILFFLSV